jgi:hypothetical protein
VIGLGQEASPTALKESDGLITINLFDEVVTPTAAAKAARSAARAGQPGGTQLMRPCACKLLPCLLQMQPCLDFTMIAWC